jgi:hypothetical protein
VMFPTAPRLPAPVVAKPAVLAAPVAEFAVPDADLVDVPVPDISISLRRKCVAATELPRRGAPQRADVLFLAAENSQNRAAHSPLFFLIEVQTGSQVTLFFQEERN